MARLAAIFFADKENSKQTVAMGMEYLNERQFNYFGATYKSELGSTVPGVVFIHILIICIGSTECII